MRIAYVVDVHDRFGSVPTAMAQIGAVDLLIVGGDITTGAGNDLERATVTYEKRVSELVSADEDVQAYVKLLEERADERLQIAGYLHDDLAQVLFRLSIQVDVARKLLEKGQTEDVGTQLDKIRQSKQETSDRIRALIRDLHRSPLGAKGLAEALESFTDEVGRDSSIRTVSPM